MLPKRNCIVALGATATLGLASASAQARSLFVPNYRGESVSVVNTTTNAVTKTINLSGGPWLSAITPNGKTAWVVQYDSGGLVPINAATGAVGTPIPIAGSNEPYDLAITPDGSKAFVANSGNGTVTPIDLKTRTSGTPISVGLGTSYTYALTITPNGKTVYASNYGTSQVVPVNASSGSVGTPITVAGAYYSAITPNGKTLWVIAYDAHEIVPIDTVTNTAGTGIPIPGGTDLEGITISPNGTTAYVTDGTGHEAFPVDLSTRSVGLPIQFGSGTYPWFITMTPTGKTAFTSMYDAGAVGPITTATNTLGTPVTVGSEPGELSVVPNQGPRAAFAHRVRGHRVSLNGSKSSDSDGHVASFAWSFGDGSTATTTSATVSHRYAHSGRYRVTLIVTDNEGCSTKLVFTGQTAYCNGTKAARITHTVVIVKAKRKTVKVRPAPPFTG